MQCRLPSVNVWAGKFGFKHSCCRALRSSLSSAWWRDHLAHLAGELGTHFWLAKGAMPRRGAAAVGDVVAPAVDFDSVREVGVSLWPTRYRIAWDTDDPVPGPIRRQLSGSVQAARTCADGACAIHATWGVAAAGGMLQAAAPRDIAVAGLRRLPGAAVPGSTAAAAYEAIKNMLWTEFAVPCLRGSGCEEAGIFWSALQRVCPALVAECEGQFFAHLSADAADEGAPSQASAAVAVRSFFCVENEAFVRRVAELMCYVPEGLVVSVDETGKVVAEADVQVAFGAFEGQWDKRGFNTARSSAVRGDKDSGTLAGARRESRAGPCGQRSGERLR